MDKTNNLAEALIPGGLAFVMQAALIFAMGLRLRWTQLLGAMIVSGITGGGVALFLAEVAHVPAASAGALGAISGTAPAVIVPLLFVRAAAKRLGVSAEDFSTFLPQLREQMGGESVSTPPTTQSQEDTHV